jgi:hypothetical protein
MCFIVMGSVPCVLQEQANLIHQALDVDYQDPFALSSFGPM